MLHYGMNSLTILVFGLRNINRRLSVNSNESSHLTDFTFQTPIIVAAALIGGRQGFVQPPFELQPGSAPKDPIPTRLVHQSQKV
mmetsp:Transcript_38836/g.93887  ORF Transcript_38836/g.93887 Transcript_38836/m.93887 type:complete len:84 (+) Transcript_38836:423-674(+)